MFPILPPIAPPHAAPKAPKIVLRAPCMSQPKGERGRNLLRYVLAGARTSRTRSAAWVRRHGTREMMAILWRESEWGCTGPHFPRSRRSTAFGVAGFLNQTWYDVGVRKTNDVHGQIEACFRYLDVRYHGQPSYALAFHRKHGWF